MSYLPCAAEGWHLPRTRGPRSSHGLWMAAQSIALLKGRGHDAVNLVEVHRCVQGRATGEDCCRQPRVPILVLAGSWRPRAGQYVEQHDYYPRLVQRALKCERSPNSLAHRIGNVQHTALRSYPIFLSWISFQTHVAINPVHITTQESPHHINDMGTTAYVHALSKYCWRIAEDSQRTFFLRDGVTYSPPATENVMAQKGDLNAMPTCSDCKYYRPINENEGDCLGAKVPADRDAGLCPARAFTPK